MSILGSVLGMGYCQLCKSSHCVHVSGDQQQQDALSQYHNYLHGTIGVGKIGIATTISGAEVTIGGVATIGQLPESKPNKKLLLLME